jgi:hypothetical protein
MTDTGSHGLERGPIRLAPAEIDEDSRDDAFQFRDIVIVVSH